jgi:hypothetical protein
MKTITTTIVAAMAGGFLACSSTSATDGGTTTTASGTTSAVTTSGSTSGTSTGGVGTSTGGAGTTTGSSTAAGTSTGGVGTTTGSSTTGGFPAVPTIGTEIDRMGRPAINTALTAPLGFGVLPDGGTIPAPAAKDLYNADNNPLDWPVNWLMAFASSLAVYDGLDGVCGNQPPGLPDAGQMPGRYDTLAGVLTDDQLYIDTTVTSCAIYLGVELEFLGALPAGTDCGGRTPLENVIDPTYSLLAAGTLSGVTNGVTVKAGAQADLMTFPFLATPN